VSGSSPTGLRQRLPTALVLFAVVCGVLFWLPPIATLALIFAAFLVGAWEWSAFLARDRRGLRAAFVALVGLGIMVAWQSSEAHADFVLLLAAAGVWCCRLPISEALRAPAALIFEAQAASIRLATTATTRRKRLNLIRRSSPRRCCNWRR
jgi:CDP-diglyceride synthetase